MKSDQPNHQRQQRRQRSGWQFTFFGETTPKKSEEKQQGKTDQKPTNSSYFPLGMATVGECLTIVDIEGKETANRLLAMGLIPGTELRVVSCTPGGSVIVAVKDNRIGLNAGMAQNLLVSTEPLIRQRETENNSNRTTLADLQVSQKGKVASYEKTADPTQKHYRKKLLAMGLTPGTEFTVTRVAPLGDPIQIQVRGFNLSLRKDEAQTLLVEVVN